jgi:hypothetical protein
MYSCGHFFSALDLNKFPKNLKIELKGDPTDDSLKKKGAGTESRGGPTGPERIWASRTYMKKRKNERR